MELCKIHKGLDVFDTCEDLPFLDCFDLIKIYADIVSSKDQTKVGNLGHMKLRFIDVSLQFSFSEYF